MNNSNSMEEFQNRIIIQYLSIIDSSHESCHPGSCGGIELNYDSITHVLVIKNWRNKRPGNEARLTHLLPFASKMCSCLPYSGFLLRVKTFTKFAFLWWFAKVLSAKSTLNRFQTPWHPGTSYVTAPTCKSSLPLTMFAYFQHADFVLPNLDGPLLTAAPVSTIRAANREVKLVLDYPARQRRRTLRWPSNAALMVWWTGYFKFTKDFSVKNYFQAICEVFTCERNLLYGIYQHKYEYLSPPQMEPSNSWYMKVVT